ncbi:glutamyl-tRNA(Gln) amidotransferase subunit B, mitochondrial-like isoform X2 [Watersipora subatra]
MPSGYQITQYRHPLAIGGELDYVIYVRGRHKKARICKARLQQIQLEQDSGKSLHDSEGRQSLVDLNRAGVALMEIVTEPDFEDGEQAAAFVRDIQASLKLINTCDGKMEQGSLRIDANISVHKPGSPYGVRTEVKNLNSVKSVEQAIDYEVKRQKNLLARGGQVINQTMSFDCDTRQTVAMRDKERLQDYRFMAEPNLPPIVLTDGSTDNPHILSIDHIRAGMPELLPALRQRLISYGLSLEQAMTTIELRLVNIFEEMLKLSSNPTVSSQSAFRFLNLVVVRACSEQKCSLEHLLSVVTLEKLSHLWHAYEKEALTHISSTELLHRLLNEPAATVQALLESGEFTRISDEREILRYCVAVAENNPKLARRYQKKKGSREFAELISIIQKDSENRIDHVDLFRVLRAYLDSKPSSSNS